MTTPCRNPAVDPDDWFAHRGSLRADRAKRLCDTCPLFWQCRQYAIDVGVPHGIFGGLDGQDRARVWGMRGGRPTGFDDEVRRMTDALLEQRDIFEKWDHRADQKGDEYARSGGKRTA